ncbi:zona pellucida sperm-binding protein 3 receptor [Lepisosteus oculatus]|uniref:zona pellucida sperm-binding protein 3 receptor n=1 Tax=Lepisosteus oculatus TaxID=7918 RepID=UPI00371A554C
MPGTQKSLLFEGKVVFLLFLPIAEVLGNCGQPPMYPTAQPLEEYMRRKDYSSGAKVTYKCIIGYRRLMGSSSIQCVDGQWTPLKMMCERKSCGSAGEILNGRFKYEDVLFGHKALAECNIGYHLVGRNYRQCLDSGWDGDIPHCKIVKCPDPPEVTDAEVAGLTQGPFDFNSVISYRCLRGQLIGDREIFCTENGTWSSPPPECKEIVCANPHVTNGRKTHGYGRTYKYKDIVSIACNPGYHLNGTGQILCGEHGHWLPYVPQCLYRRAMTCSQPSVANGRMTSQHRPLYKYNDKVTFACDAGFRLNGTGKITCREFNHWAPRIPQCVPLKGATFSEIVCGPPGKIKNGRFVTNKTHLGSVATAVCNKGYRLVGQGQRKCLNTGWDGDIPQCEITTCISPNVTNGFQKGKLRDTYKYRKSLSFACHEGFMLNGPSSVTCDENGEWSPSIPTCSALNGTCSIPPHQNNAHPRVDFQTQKEYASGAEVMYTCALGYRRMGGSSSVQCINGEWTQLKLKCEPKSCGSAGEIRNGRFMYDGVHFGSRATAVCDEGYQLVGRGYRDCLASGWSGDIPHCETVRCPDPPEVTDGEVAGLEEGPFDFNSVISYRCLRGQLIGDKEIFCTQNGTWSRPLPQCKEVYCMNPVVTNGRQIRGRRSTYKYRETVAFECDLGYKLNGPSMAMCEADGKWSHLPACVKVQCSSPLVHAGKIIQGSSGQYIYGHSVTIECDYRYQLNGHSKITCDKDGQWKPSVPTCESSKAECPYPSVDFAGIQDGYKSRFTTGDTVTLSCSYGYRLNGPSSIWCDRNGQWYPYLPKCEYLY